MNIPSFDEVMKLTGTISVHNILEPEECRAMYDTLCEIPESSLLVEVGCDYGRSSSLIQQMAAAKRALCIHIDPWMELPDRAGEWMRTMCERCAYQPFVLLRMTTGGAEWIINNLCRSGIDMVFIDGCHDQDVVEQDLRIVASHIKPGGLLTAHDYPSAGVTEAIDPFVAEGWDKVRQAGGFGAWRRK